MIGGEHSPSSFSLKKCKELQESRSKKQNLWIFPMCPYRRQLNGIKAGEETGQEMHAQWVSAGTRGLVNAE